MNPKQFEILDPDYKEKIRESWKKQPFLHSLGTVIDEIGPGFMQISLPVTEELSQVHGYVSGSVVGALADVVGGYAAFTISKPNTSMLTVEYKINFMSPATGQRLIGRGYLEKPGSRISVARAEVFSQIDGKEKQIALATMTMITLDE